MEWLNNLVTKVALAIASLFGLTVPPPQIAVPMTPHHTEIVASGTPSIQQSTSTPEISSWQTYTDSIDGFTLKYPAHMIATSTGSSLSVVDINNYAAPGNTPSEDISIGIRACDVNNVQSNTGNKIQSQKNIGGITWGYTGAPYCENFDGDPCWDTSNSSEYVTNVGKRCFTVDFRGASILPISQQVLSTIHFKAP